MTHPHVTHFDDAPSAELRRGHLNARWTALGDAAGSVGIGATRLQIAAGGWSTPAHEHGSEEELFYVLAGRGISWVAGETCDVGPGDCILHPPLGGAHTLHALEDLDVIAFGPRYFTESLQFPRTGLSKISGRIWASDPGYEDGIPAQFVRELALGAPALPDTPGPRPATVVNLRDVATEVIERPRCAATERLLGEAVGSRTTGLNHVEVVPGRLMVPLHCHSAEEELFAVLEGDGDVLLGEEEIPVRAGSVVGRPPGTGVAHTFRAGPNGLTVLAYGTREPNDICFYPTSDKVSFRGVRLIARIERLDYWDGED